MYLKTLPEIRFKSFSSRTEANTLSFVDDMVKHSEIDGSNKCIGKDKKNKCVIPFIKKSFGIVSEKKLQSNIDALVVREENKNRKEEAIKQHRCPKEQEDDRGSDKHF